MVSSRNNNNNKQLFFFFTICIGVTLALLSPTTTTAALNTAENDAVVAENLRLKSELSQLATSLLSHRFHLLLLKGKFFVLEYSIKEAIIEFKTDDERINKLLGKFLLLSEFCQHKLENVIQENNATIASLLKNTEATHAAERKNEGDFVSAVKKAEGLVRDISGKAFVLSKEAPKRANAFDKQNIGLFDRLYALISGTSSLAAERNNEGDFVSAVKKAEGFVRDISEKGFVLTKEALRRAEAFEKQNIGLSEKMNFWLSSTFDRVVAKYGEYLGLKSKENVNEEKEGNDQIHEF